MHKNLSKIIVQTSDDTLQSMANFLLRTGVSVSMIYLHGWPKLASYIAGDWNFPDPLNIGDELSLLLAIFAEVICSILLIFGVLSRVSVIPLIITMLVAMLIFNAGQPLIVKEKAFIFLMSYVFILLAGSGKYSIDAKLSRLYI